ncbi:hypothetical protein [uncultured Meiothermus sp.]|jgi:hypothetical protein|uniref:hypothetical protein n=1 Tax=uncultured Meiothermus sp. TaxID=157471 RepID=UPI00261BCC1F|nr:hypothetical protein [uncultured Meiothermus sp.]
MKTMKTTIRLIIGLILAVVLVACPQQPPPPAPTITVIGKVLTHDGKPGAFLPVLVADQKTATDASGNFSAADVAIPYDLVVLQASRNQAYVYEGLSRRDPIVLVSGSGSTYDNASEVTLTSSNVNTTPPPAGGFADGHITCLGVATRQVSCGITGSVFPSVKHNVSWAGPSSVFINFYALQMHKNSRNVVTSFLRFGRAENRHLTNAQPSTGNFALEPVQNQAIAGSTTPPPGYTLVSRALGFRALGHYLYPFSYELDQTGIAPNFSWASPAVPGMDLYLSASARKGDAHVYAYLAVTPVDSAINLRLPTPPEQLQPADNALGVTTATTFSWTPFAEGVHSVSVSPVTPGALNLTIYSAATSLQLPDLSSLGYPLPKGVTYRWMVGGFAPFASVDDLANGVPYIYGVSSSGGSGQRVFTTAP